MLKIILFLPFLLALRSPHGAAIKTKNSQPILVERAVVVETSDISHDVLYISSARISMQ